MFSLSHRYLHFWGSIPTDCNSAGHHCWNILVSSIGHIEICHNCMWITRACSCVYRDYHKRRAREERAKVRAELVKAWKLLDPLEKGSAHPQPIITGVVLWTMLYWTRLACMHSGVSAFLNVLRKLSNWWSPAPETLQNLEAKSKLFIE